MDIAEQDDDYEREIVFTPQGDGKVVIAIYSIHTDENQLKTKKEQNWILLSIEEVQDILNAVRSLGE